MQRIAVVALVLGACMQESGGTGGTGGSGGSGTGGDGGSSTGGDGGTGGTGGMPMDVPSRQTVTFAVGNGAAADRYVVTMGWYCDDYAISFGATVVPRTLGFQCLCECPNPGTARATRYRHLAPGGSYRVTWDARMLLTYSDPYDCAAHGWPGLPPTSELFGIHQPVPAGRYRATVAFESALPAACNPVPGTGDFDCGSGPGGGGGGPGGFPPPVQQICPSSAGQVVEFDLPQTGDITVPITLQ